MAGQENDMGNKQNLDKNQVKPNADQGKKVPGQSGGQDQSIKKDANFDSGTGSR